MGMQLNIKDPEAIRLAGELSRASRSSIAATIRRALEREQQLRAADIEGRRKRIEAAVERYQRAIPDEWRGKTSKQIMDEIYDEGGLPIA
jgi:hypothetical protein